MLSFANVEKNHDVEPTVMNTDRVWAIEQGMIDIYFLLVHRIKGLGWSLKDFWEMDTWTTSKLYCMELDLIEEEERELNKNKKNNLEDKNNPEVDALYEEMFGNDWD